MGDRTKLTLADGMTGMTENVFLNIKNRSKVITAQVDIPEGGGSGAILVQGGRFGGWALYLYDGIPAYDYNFLGLSRTTIEGNSKLPAGRSEIRFAFDYDGGGLAKGGTGTLYVNGEKVGEGRVERTQPMVFSADETADVGIDLATPVVERIGAERASRFTGEIESVVVEVQ
jgi:arylsulfatase